MEWHDVDTLASDPSNRNIARILAAIGRAWVPTDDLRTWAYNLLDLEPDARLVDVLEQARAAIHILNRVHDIVETQEYDDVAASERLEEARHRAHFLREYLLNEAAVRQCGESHFPPSLKLYSEAKDKEGPFPTLLKHLLRRLHALKYRRVDDQCYSERRTDDDYDSHAYVQACSIQQFILDECDKDTSPDMWDILNAKDNSLKKQLHDYLCNSRDREFVQLEPNRGILSFQNGLYVLGQHMFYPFADRANWVRLAAQEDTARGNIGTYDPPCAPTRTDVALNFFDARFPVEYMHDPLSVPTPLIDKILLAQQLTDETRHCIWVFLGRLLYNLRDKDNWVFILFLLGIGGTGKSILADIVKHIFPKWATASLAHGDRFVLSAIWNKLLWYCTEVRRDTSMFSGPNASDLPRVIEGTEVSIEVKNKTPFTHTITTPGLLCGNEMAGRETSGALQRRYMIVEFNHHVGEQDKDPGLFDKMKPDIGNIVLKMNFAYLNHADKYGGCDIWAPGVVSEQLHEFKKNATMQLDPLARFLEDRQAEGYVTAADLGVERDDIYVPRKEFEQSYTQFRAANNYPKLTSFDRDHYNLCFSRYSLAIKKDERDYDNRQGVRHTWILGIGRHEVWV